MVTRRLWEIGGWSERGIVFLFASYGLWLGLSVSHPVGGIDDAFYYLKIAEHVARGDGSTFDGIHLTNGYHPLWLFTLVPLFWFTSDPDAVRTLSIILQAVFYGAGVATFYVTARLRVARLPAIAAALLWALLVYRQSFSGLEFAVYALGITLVTYVYLRWTAAGAPSARKYLALGILSSLVFLARLDAIWLSFSIGLALFFLEWRGGLDSESVKRLLAFALPVLFTAFAYAVVNWSLFGNSLPISGAVKRSWSDYYLSQDSIYQERGWLAAKISLLLLPVRLIFQSRHLLDLLYPLYLTVGTGIAGIVWLVGRKFRNPWFQAIQPLGPFVLFSVLSFLSNVILYQDWVVFGQYWYYAIQPWLAALLFGILLDRVYASVSAKGHRVWMRRISILALIAVCLGIPWYTVRQFFTFGNPSNPSAAREPFEQAARWLASNTPPDATIGAWNAGIISFYSERRVVNLDGLVNSWDFFEREQYDLCQYWQKNGIAYLADGFVEDRASSSIPAYPYYARCADRLELLWSEESTRPPTRFKIYRIRWQ